jgi:outer membrane protein assembly factor BamD
MKKQNIAEATKEKLSAQFQKHAVDAYSRIVTRYPAMGRAEDAKKRLIALNAPVPSPTPEALAESKAEEQSRQSAGMVAGVLSNFKKHPMVAKAARVGEPSLEDEKVASAPQMVQELQTQLSAASQPNQKVGLAAVGGGTGAVPGANEPPPRTSDGKSSNAGAPPAPAPAQVNEIQSSHPQAQGNSSSAGSGEQTASATDKSASASDQKKDAKQDSSSKKKKKKGLRKLNPF